jgi:glucose uptake protein
LVVHVANLLLMAALSVAPISVVYPVGLGVAGVIGMAWTLFPVQGSLLLPLGGTVALLAAVVVNAFAYSTYAHAQQGPPKPLMPDPRSRASKAAPASPAAGVTLSVLGGVALGMVVPLLSLCRSGEDGLAAYSAGLLMAIAIAVSTVVFSPFYMTFAVHGAPVQIRAYFKGSKKQHLQGLLAGGVWMCGLLAIFVSGGTLANVQAGAVAIRAFTGGTAVLGALWGLVAWREFKGSRSNVRILLTVMLLLWVAGAAMLVLTADTAL